MTALQRETLSSEEIKTLIQEEGEAAKIIISEKISNGKLTKDDYEECRRLRKARIRI